MTGLQLALLSGALIGLGAALLTWRLAPTDPDLADALQRLAPEQPTSRHTRRADPTGSGFVEGETDAAVPDGSPAGVVERVGAWAMKNVPAAAWAHTPTKDLAILRISHTRFYGEKVTWALLGLVMPPVLALCFALIGLPLPFAIPTLGSLALAGLFWFMPNYNAADDAKKARIEFNRALGAYIDMVATGIRDGSSGPQALAAAAEIGDTWVFTRLESELRRARYMTRAPWDTLHGLADELGVAELDDLADIMQQSGQDGAQIYTNLRARAAALRSAMLSAELGKANATSERMYIPASLFGIVFMAILVAPSLLRLTT